MSFPPAPWIEGDFDRLVLVEEVRPALATQLQARLAAGKLREAADTLADFLDTWPAAALVDDAAERWATGAPSGRDLAVLGRVAALLCAARRCPSRFGWPVPEGADAPSEPEIALAAGVHVLASGDLVPRREEVARKLARGEWPAVYLDGSPPTSPEVELALGELRLEGDHQRAFERFGPAGLTLDPPPWSSVLGRAPAGKPGPRLARAAASAVLPATVGGLRTGQMSPVAYLMFAGPYETIAVPAEMAAVLEAFGTGATLEEVALQLGIESTALADAVDQLVEAGALSAR